ncbi:MAG: aminotransferase class III-fold pyridoxal phosphate-dependent enzyme [Candidatus Nanopelagicales bacterium]
MSRTEPVPPLDAPAALDLAERYVCPNRVRTLTAMGLPLVMGRREGYRFWDLDGREFLDLHLNGGVYNLGHRNPEVVQALVQAAGHLDIGNHHFPSAERALLAERLADLTPGDLTYSVLASGGGEAIDVALKTARRVTGRRRVVSLSGAYHGHTGLALAAGDERAASAFLSDSPDVARVPYGDAGAVDVALAGEDVAAVIVETVPATLGFPVPDPDFLPGVRAACDRHGTVLVADEVQTGLGRTGRLWGVELFDVVPDVLVTGKGLSGGMYPMAATVLAPAVAGWLQDDGWGHISTFGGAEVGCPVARTVLDITTRPETVDHVRHLIARVTDTLAELQARHPDWLVEVRQTGLVVGLRFAHEQGGPLMTRALYDQGVWAMFAGFDPSVLQVKPGLLLDDALLDRAAEAMDRAMAVAAGWAA